MQQQQDFHKLAGALQEIQQMRNIKNNGDDIYFFNIDI